MSKARGNVVEPWAVINKHGADALRWYLFTSTPAGNVRRFDEKVVAEVLRRFLLTLWNVYSFFVTYASIDNYLPVAGGERDSTWVFSLGQLSKPNSRAITNSVSAWAIFAAAISA